MLGVLCNTGKIDQDFHSGSKFGCPKDFFQGLLPHFHYINLALMYVFTRKFDKIGCISKVLVTLSILLVSELFLTVLSSRS